MKTKILLFFLCFWCLSAGGGHGAPDQPKQNSIYTVQVMSYRDTELGQGRSTAQQLEQKEFKDVRIEKIGDLYILRIGKYETAQQGQPALTAVRRLFPQSFLRSAYFLEERVVYPAAADRTAKTPTPVATPATIEPAAKTAAVAPTPIAETPSGWGIPSPILLAFALFLLLLILPFIPGFRELRNKRDADPLVVNMNYAKDPRYFEQSFKKIIEKGLLPVGTESGLKQIKLSKQETIEVCDSKIIKTGETVSHILYVKGTFLSQKGARIPAEVYAKGTATLGEETLIRALAGDGDIVLGPRTKVIRWVGTDGAMRIGEACTLGVSCACDGSMEIDKGCVFRALFGNPVATHKASLSEQVMPRGEPASERETPAAAPDNRVRNIEDLAWYATRNTLSVPPSARVDTDIIARHHIRIGKEAVLTGSVKAYGNVVLNEAVTVHGNIFAEGTITIGPRCTISGDIFCQNGIHLAEGTRVGRAGAVKSVIGKKFVRLENNVIIFGYVLTEGTGDIS